MHSPEDCRSQQSSYSRLTAFTIDIVNSGSFFAEYKIGGKLEATISLTNDMVSVHILKEGNAKWLLSDMKLAGEFLHSYFL